MEPEHVPVTVIVPTRNAATDLRECLLSVRWADQVLVVDSHSDDGTVEIAKAHGAEVHQFQYEGGWPKKKNWALQSLPIRNPWVLLLDADERVTSELAAEIAQVIATPDIDGYYARWKFVFLGRWMKHCWRHGWMLRLVRRGHGRFEDLGLRDEGGWDNEVHENLIVEGRVARLRSWLLHESQESLSQWLRRQNEFSDWNAARRLRQGEQPAPLRNLGSRDPLRRRRALKRVYLRLPARPFLMFVYLYFVRLGCLDGRAGFYFCALRAAHELNTEAKIFEARLGVGTQS